MQKEISFIPIIIILIYVLVFIQGLLNAINPRFLWNIFESWKALKEPSKGYFLTRRIVGIVSMLIVIALILFPYIMSKI